MSDLRFDPFPQRAIGIRDKCRVSFPASLRTAVQEDLRQAPAEDDRNMLPDAGLQHMRELAFLRADNHPQALLRPGIQEKTIVDAGGKLVEDAARFTFSR